MITDDFKIMKTCSEIVEQLISDIENSEGNIESEYEVEKYEIWRGENAVVFAIYPDDIEDPEYSVNFHNDGSVSVETTKTTYFLTPTERLVKMVSDIICQDIWENIIEERGERQW